MDPCSKKTTISQLHDNNNINNVNHNTECQETQEDRLSKLPDNILETILSLLPISTAVSTSALNHHWRHLWTKITHLSIIFPQKPFFDYFNNYVNTVDHILSQLKSIKLHTFHLHVPYNVSRFLAQLAVLHRSSQLSQLDGPYTGFLSPWITRICGLNPEVINVKFMWDSYIRMPLCVFKTQSLVELKLTANTLFPYRRNVMPSIDLPKLKKLHITLSDVDGPLMKRLFKSCPSLEDLYLRYNRVYGDHFIHIAAPNLKYLVIQIQEYESNYCRIAIDAPKLEQCCLWGNLVYYEFVKNPSNLQRVIISIAEDSFEGLYDDRRAILGKIHGIVSVRCLILRESGVDLLHFLNNLVGGGNALPIFHNLVHLRFYCNDDIQLHQLPVCFLSNLQRLVIERMIANSDYDDAIKLPQQILNNAPALGHLHLYAHDHSTVRDIFNQDKARLEYNFCKKLFMLSKFSVNCQIEFFGNMITASNNNFRNDVLPP